MKETKKDPYEERVEKLLSISGRLKVSLADMALANKLSPSEMLLVAAHFSARLCSSASKCCDADISRIVDVFDNTMWKCIEEDL